MYIRKVLESAELYASVLVDFLRIVFVSFLSISPLGRCFHRVAMSVSLSVCLSPFHVIFFEASHWPSVHMIRLLSQHCPLWWHQYSENEKKCTSLRWSDPGLHDAVRHDGISTLKIKRNVHHYNDQILAFMTRAPENFKLAGNWPKMVAMCGLQE